MTGRLALQSQTTETSSVGLNRNGPNLWPGAVSELSG